MKVTNAMVERAAKVLRRTENPAKFDRRPWRKVISKEHWRNKARRALTAAQSGTR